MNLQGKTALITGASRRIGREIAVLLASRGVSIVAHYDQSRKAAEGLKEEIEDLGVKAALVRASFCAKGKSSVAARIKKLVQDVHKKVPRVDILVNNAAIFYPTPLGKIKEKDWDDFMAINLKAPFFLAEALGERMAKRKRGKIINLVDWTAARPKSRFIPYAISKAGLMAATAGLARALAPHVQVTSIAPGPILPVAGSSRKERQAVIKQTLLKRFGHPKDIAETVRFLCEDTDFITGALIPVDGGASVV